VEEGGGIMGRVEMSKTIACPRLLAREANEQPLDGIEHHETHKPLA